MNIIYKNIISAIVLTSILALAGIYLFQASKVKADLSRVSVLSTCSTQGTSATSLATTSVAYLSVGTGTTTATCNMMTAGSGAEIYDQATLFILQTGSSSPFSLLNIDIQDSWNGIDWYARSYAWNVETGTATATPSINAAQQYQVMFASSTINRQIVTVANSATSSRSITVPTVAPFIRAIFTIPVGSAASAVWANWVGKVQISD